MNTAAMTKKGVILDTNASVKDASAYMVNNSRIAAFGKVKHSIKPINIGDYVFLFAKGRGLIAAASVTGELDYDGDNTCFKPVKFIFKPKYINDKPVALPVKQIKELLGRNFFWAKTVKSPYLSVDESEIMLNAIMQLQNKS